MREEIIICFSKRKTTKKYVIYDNRSDWLADWERERECVCRTRTVHFVYGNKEERTQHKKDYWERDIRTEIKYQILVQAGSRPTKRISRSVFFSKFLKKWSSVVAFVSGEFWIFSKAVRILRSKKTKTKKQPKLIDNFFYWFIGACVWFVNNSRETDDCCFRSIELSLHWQVR